MVVEKEGFGAVKNNNIICYCLVIIVKKNIVYIIIACSRRGMCTEIFLKQTM